MKFTLRHLLFPFVLWWYHRASEETRGEYLVPSQFHNPTEDSLEFRLERFPGMQYGNLRLETSAPRLLLSRKDGCRIEHDFRNKKSSVVEIVKTGFLVLHREGRPAFVLCQCKPFQAVQFVSVWNRLPTEIRSRLKIPAADEFNSKPT